MHDRHLLQDGGAVIRDKDLTLGALNLPDDARGLETSNQPTQRHEQTILSAPLGPKLVRTASATANKRKRSGEDVEWTRVGDAGRS